MGRCAHCDCTAFVRDPEGCAADKRLSNREQRAVISEAGQLYLESVTEGELRDAFEDLGYPPSSGTRIYGALRRLRPGVRLDLLKRAPNVGRGSWRHFWSLLSARGMFVAQAPPARCPHCGETL